MLKFRAEPPAHDQNEGKSRQTLSAPTLRPPRHIYSLFRSAAQPFLPLVRQDVFSASTDSSAFGFGFFGYFGPRSHPILLFRIVTPEPMVSNPPTIKRGLPQFHKLQFNTFRSTPLVTSLSLARLQFSPPRRQ